MLQKMEILNFPPVSVELEMTTTAEGNPPFCREENRPPSQSRTNLLYVLFIQLIFSQGGTIKWLVNLLKIDKKKREEKLISEEVNDNVLEHGIDVISGKKGNRVWKKFQQLDEAYLKPFFCIQNPENQGKCSTKMR